MDAEIRARARNLGLTPVGDGTDRELTASRLGELLTADWKHTLVAGGLAWSGHIGTISAGAAEGLIVGGGNGTTIDSDEPEMFLGVDAGYFLIPIAARVACNVDMDANAEQGSIILFADRTRAPDNTVTGTPGVITPNNQLDGGPAFPGRWFGGVTTVLGGTDPVLSELLDYEIIVGSDNGTAGNLVSNRLKMHYEPTYPTILKGPCSLVMCYGGTAAVNGMASIVVAVVPSNFHA